MNVQGESMLFDKPYEVFQAVLSLLIVASVIAMQFVFQQVPEWMQQALWVVLGFHFGQRVGVLTERINGRRTSV